jgi:hypothetical protein
VQSLFFHLARCDIMLRHRIIVITNGLTIAFSKVQCGICVAQHAINHFSEMMTQCQVPMLGCHHCTFTNSEAPKDKALPSQYFLAPYHSQS